MIHKSIGHMLVTMFADCDDAMIRSEQVHCEGGCHSMEANALSLALRSPDVSHEDVFYDSFQSHRLIFLVLKLSLKHP